MDLFFFLIIIDMLIFFCIKIFNVLKRMYRKLKKRPTDDLYVGTHKARKLEIETNQLDFLD